MPTKLQPSMPATLTARTHTEPRLEEEPPSHAFVSIGRDDCNVTAEMSLLEGLLVRDALTKYIEVINTRIQVLTRTEDASASEARAWQLDVRILERDRERARVLVDAFCHAVDAWKANAVLAGTTD